MAVEVVANPYSWWVWSLLTKHVVRTERKDQGKAMIDFSFVIRVVLKAVLEYKDKALHLKSACGCCMSRHLNEHSPIVVKKRISAKEGL